ncbi:MAG: T9SS type A sorting domain-containing protein [Ignavibacteriaceae bacterium]
MESFKNILFIFFITSTFQIICYAQHGNPNLRNTAVLDGNNIKAVITNYGVIAQPASEGPRFTWKHPYNIYASDVSILLGLELPIDDYWMGNIPPDGIPDTIHSVIITAVERPGGGEGENGVSYTFEPLPGYFNINHNVLGEGIALSHIPDTWPSLWPDHPEYGTGVWNGLYGPDNFVGTQEALFVMDDFNDLENNLINKFWADSTDTTITGHGLEVKVRYVQLDHPDYNDVLFRVYDIKNNSIHNYHKLVFGNLIGTYIGGGAPEFNDDVTLYYPMDNLIVSYDFDNYIKPNANPNWIGNPGMFGETFIHSPGEKKITSFRNFVPAGDITMADDEEMWNKLKPGNYSYPSSVYYVDSIPFSTHGEDGDYMYGGEYFSLDSGETKRIVTAVAFGYTKSEILKKIKYAEALYHSDFDTSSVINSITITNPVYHKTVSGNEVITWNSTSSTGTVEIWYSSFGGNNWEPIIRDAPNSGSYNWNTFLFEDGSFARLLILLKDDDGFIHALNESNYFTVNNPGNGSPYIEIRNPEIHYGTTITDEEYDFNFLIGDPENDALVLKVFYKVDSDTAFSLSYSFNASSDTVIQTIPINLKFIPNSDKMTLKFELTDGDLSYSLITPQFKKDTPRILLPSQNYEWIRNYAEVPVEIRVIDSTLFTSQEYIISFNDSTPNTFKKFSVYKPGSNEYVLLNHTLYPGSESHLFDGMVIYTEDILTSLDTIRSGWNNIHPQNLRFVMDQFVSTNLSAYRYPFDYKFVFSDTYNDSSNYLVNIFGSGAPPANPNLNFKVYRNIDDFWERIQFGFNEPEQFRKNILSFGDVAILSDPSGFEFSWRVVFQGDSSSKIPGGGDTLYLYTEKGLSIYDSIRVHGLTVNVVDLPKVPVSYSLSQNYPNPFNPVTKLNYSLAHSGKAIIKIYNVLGREIRTLVNEEKPAGNHTIEFDAAGLASGVYIYRIQSGDFVSSKKMLLLK